MDKAAPAIDLLTDDDLQPRGTYREGRPEFTLMRAYTFEDITVPAGYVTDRYSLPGRLIPAIWEPRHCKYATPAVVHDWLYETQLKPFEDANAIFMRLMKAAGVTPVKRWICFWAVTMFGERGYGVVDGDNFEMVRAVRPDLR